MREFTAKQIERLNDYEKLMLINHLIGQVDHYQKANLAQFELIQSLLVDTTRVKRNKPFSVVKGGLNAEAKSQVSSESKTDKPY